MNEYQKRILQARKEFINLNFEQEKELFKIYNDAGNKLIGEILDMPDSRTRNHKIESYKIINKYRTELYYNLDKIIKENIRKSSDIQKGVQLSFVDMISPNEITNEALKRTITKISSDTVKHLIAGNLYADGKTLSKRLWNITGDNASKVDMLIKTNIAKGANVKELAAELDKYVNPKNRITAKSFKAGMNSNKISYQAQRLARTSITHAQTETLIQNAKKNPFCRGLKWNLSASHFSRMHGKTDICDDLNGRVFKPEELPLQHPNCLCYMTEVIEDIDKCIETMKNWSNGKSSPEVKRSIDKWIEAGEDKTSIKVTTPKAIQTKISIKNEKFSNTSANNLNKDYNNIRIDSKVGNVNKYSLQKSNVKWENYLNVSGENSEKLNEIHSSLNEFMHKNNKEKLVLLDMQQNIIIHELEGSKSDEVELTKETKKLLKTSNENSIIFTHNHPSKTTFSSHDIYQIIKYKSIQSLTLECADSSKFIIERGNMKSSFLSSFNFPSKYDEIYWKVAEQYPELDDEVKRYQIWNDFLDSVNKEVAKVYGLIYKEVSD